MATIIEITDDNYITSNVPQLATRPDRGSSFTHSTPYTIATIGLWMIRGGQPGTITMHLYAADANHAPTGGSLGSATYDGDSLQVNPNWTWTEFSFSDIAIPTGVEHCYVITVSNGNYITDYISIKKPSGSHGGYQAGREIYSQSGTWYYTGHGLIYRIEGTETGHAKATNPTPADTDTEVDWATPTLSWSGNGDTYDVRGGAAGNFVLLTSGISGTSYTLSAAERLLCKGGVVSWRVDSTVGAETLTGDTWTFDPRPGQVSNPTPADVATDQALTIIFSWDAAANADTYHIHGTAGAINTFSAEDLVTLTWLLGYGTISHSDNVTWQVDATNYYGTTDGPSWSFDALDLQYLVSSWEAIPVSEGGSGSGLGPLTGGAVGVDFRWTGINNMVVTKRIVAAAASAIWYEGF
ncbi:MAG: hypothetical protein GQ565_02920 [Candidatus Aegiribacteria sp.]|nr:hypothetical protein [Candidatus Aegiribacteria sp.]